MPFLKILEKSGPCLLNMNQIEYIQWGDDHTVEIRTNYGAKARALTSLSEVEKALRDNGFQIIEVGR